MSRSILFPHGFHRVSDYQMSRTRRNGFHELWKPLAAVMLLLVSCLSARSALYRTNGWTLQATLKLDKPSILLGEPMSVTLRVTNHSEEDLEIIVGGTNGDYGGSISAFDSDGHKVPRPTINLMMGGMYGPSKLPAKGCYDFRVFLPKSARFERPGDYRIVSTRTLEIIKPVPGRSFTEVPRTTIVATDSRQLRVLPHDTVKMGEVIESLGVRLRSDVEQTRADAAELLDFIQDERAVPHLAAAIRNEKQSLKVFNHALGAFGWSSTAEALEGLKFGISTNRSQFSANSYLFDNIRHVAAHGLARSKNPEALRHLVTFKHDLLSSVRLAVIQRVVWERNSEAKQILQDLSDDPDTMVRGEARRLLKSISTPD